MSYVHPKVIELFYLLDKMNEYAKIVDKYENINLCPEEILNKSIAVAENYTDTLIESKLLLGSIDAVNKQLLFLEKIHEKCDGTIN